MTVQEEESPDSDEMEEMSKEFVGMVSALEPDDRAIVLTDLMVRFCMGCGHELNEDGECEHEECPTQDLDSDDEDDEDEDSDDEDEDDDEEDDIEDSDDEDDDEDEEDDGEDEEDEEPVG